MNESTGLTLHASHPDNENGRANVKFRFHKLFDLDLTSDINSNEGFQWTSIYLKNLLSQYTRYVPAANAPDSEMEVFERFAHCNGGMFFIPRKPNAPKV
ncbi:hypothetical protein PFISCL1PPCAC_28799, partial [Pristionchus fissidentatus]